MLKKLMLSKTLMPNRFRLRSWYRGQIPPGRSTPLDLLMVQATAFCNIDCSYCYLPHRNQKGAIDLALLEPLFVRLEAAGLVGDSLGIAWHAGEPMTLPIAFYRDAFAEVARLAGPRLRITHHIQTNGTLITQDWCDFIRAAPVRIGLSIDGPAFLHDRFRRTRAGSGTHAKVMAGVELLRRNHIPFSAIGVLTAASLDHPDAIYDFFRELDVTDLGLNVEEVEGVHADSSLRAAGTEERYRAFFRRILERAGKDRFSLRIRELSDGIPGAQAALFDNTAGSSENNPLSIIGLRLDGRLFTWSPELMDARHPDGGDFSIGSVHDVDFFTLFEQADFLRLHNPIQRGIDACRQSCAYFGSCGGGPPGNKLAEHGRFEATETLFCRYTRQILMDVIEDEMAARLERRRKLRAERPAPA